MTRMIPVLVGLLLLVFGLMGLGMVALWQLVRLVEEE